MIPLSTAPTPNQPGRWVIPRFGPPDVLEWQIFDNGLPSPPKDAALIHILAAGIAGPDNIQRAGGYPNERCREPGFTPGYDLVGEIVSLGAPNVSFHVGDRVSSMCMIGSYSTHIVLPISEIIKIDKSDDVVKVCALPLNYMTAWGMLQRSGVQLEPGSCILVGSAAGGIGTAIAQLVKAFDLDICLIGSCSLSKFEYVKSLGYAPVDRRDPELWKTVREMTMKNAGVDVAYDAVGSRDSLEQSYRAVKEGSGRVIAIGIMGDIAADGSGMTSTLSADKLLGRRAPPRTAYWGVERAYYQETRAVWMEDFAKILEKVRSGRLNPLIARLFKLEEAIQANEMLVSGAGVMGKMEFIVDADLAKSLGV